MVLAVWSGMLVFQSQRKQSENVYHHLHSSHCQHVKWLHTDCSNQQVDVQQTSKLSSNLPAALCDAHDAMNYMKGLHQRALLSFPKKTMAIIWDVTTPNFFSLVLNSLVLFCVTLLAKEIFAISATSEKREFFCGRILSRYRVLSDKHVSALSSEHHEVCVYILRTG